MNKNNADLRDILTKNINMKNLLHIFEKKIIKTV